MASSGPFASPPKRFAGVLLALLAFSGDGDPPAGPAAGFATILEDELSSDLVALASASLEGRDSPSEGLTRAAAHIVTRLEAAGLTGAGPEGTFLLPFSRDLPAPVPEACALELEADPEAADADAGAARVFTYGEDFVPVWGADGTGRGEAVLFGFGIDSDSEKYDDITGEVAGTVAVIVEGEPRHKRKFDGPEASPDSQLYLKLATLEEEKVAGVLVVRRPPAAPASKSRSRSKADEAPEPPGLAFRHTWASWVGSPPDRAERVDIPALEITPAVAEALLGIDVLEIAGKADKTGKPPKPVRSGRTVSLAAKSEVRSLPIDNVVGILEGTDPDLADEFVVIGAHYDHVGVDPRGRIGFGADDNASGTAAMLEVVTALAAAGPRRSILACAFAAEEDGLLGSKFLCENLPVPRESLVAMLNMDMLGRGDVDEVAVLGTTENPALEKLLKPANKLHKTRIKSIVTGKGQELFERSDHFPFHQIGIPALFFFEGLPITRNADYHTWRDTIDLVDVDKVARSARLVFNVAWLLADDDQRPPPPEGH
ncbi:MAG: M20/M25/M40 family metallo-hydrolase [Planctomycetota bacterium]|jgi:hypothetical protein